MTGNHEAEGTETPTARAIALMTEALESLRGKRRAFYAEADFQQALAWEIHLAHPDAAIRLEVPLAEVGRERLDLYVAIDGERFGYELKYLLGRFAADLDEEPLPLYRGSPNPDDFSRYEIAEDIGRVERFIEQERADAGCAVVLTNLSSLWRIPAHEVTAQDAAFRIHEGAALIGTLEWGSRGTPKDPVVLTGSYECGWKPYSELEEGTGATEFRYLVLAASA
jgi:hypothetical protein